MQEHFDPSLFVVEPVSEVAGLQVLPLPALCRINHDATDAVFACARSGSEASIMWSRLMSGCKHGNERRRQRFIEDYAFRFAGV